MAGSGSPGACMQASIRFAHDAATLLVPCFASYIFCGFGLRGHLLVRSPRRGVDDEEVERAPHDVLNELLDHGVLFGAAPYDGLLGALEQERDGHDGEELGRVGVHRDPALAGLHHLHELFLQPRRASATESVRPLCRCTRTGEGTLKWPLCPTGQQT